KVKASDHEGKWSMYSTPLVLTITPPYWKTWWFRTFFLLGVAASIYFIVRLRTTQVMEQKNALETQAKHMASLHERQQAQTEYLKTLNGELQRQKEETVA